MFEGSYEPLVMFFGLTNSPATFQTMMNKIFKDMIDEGMVIIYIDYILIYTKTEAAHDEITKGGALTTMGKQSICKT